MTRKERYKRMLWAALALVLVLTVVAGYQALRDSLPDQLRIDRDGEHPLRPLTEHPLVTIQESTEASAGDGSYVIACSVGTVIPLKEVKVIPEQRQSVKVCGMPVGIYMETDGVMIIAATPITTPDGLSANPAENILKSGDYVTAIDGKPLNSKRELVHTVGESEGSPVELTVRRDGQQIRVKVTPVRAADGSYKLGIWVRDNIQGIGTLTYVAQDGRFGALGHAISDVDTGEILNLREGDLYLTEIFSVVHGREGAPGELQGVIRYEDQNRLGRITENSGLGIHGIISPDAAKDLTLTEMEIAYRQEIEKGPAQILCSVDGVVKSYEAEVTEVHLNAENTNKCFSIQVTDPVLLQKTGGIVQGMSGSPIVQKGKLIGAVTHVFVNDPTKGYGIFIENMLDGPKEAGG